MLVLVVFLSKLIGSAIKEGRGLGEGSGRKGEIRGLRGSRVVRILVSSQVRACDVVPREVRLWPSITITSRAITVGLRGEPRLGLG